MGLDVSHDAWHGAYSAFSHFRNLLAAAAGYDAEKVDWAHLTTANLKGDWDETPADPLIVLLAHSDYDGHITPRDAIPLADRLDELAPLLPSDAWDLSERAQEFARGLRAAAEAGETVEFA